GALLSVTLKKRLDSVAKPTAVKKGVHTPSRSSRLIVRNLPFDATEQDLRALFLPYGTIYSIHMPQAVSSSAHASAVIPTTEGEIKTEATEAEIPPRSRGKGFAFVWMWAKKEAE